MAIILGLSILRWIALGLKQGWQTKEGGENEMETKRNNLQEKRWVKWKMSKNVSEKRAKSE